MKEFSFKIVGMVFIILLIINGKCNIPCSENTSNSLINEILKYSYDSIYKENSNLFPDNQFCIVKNEFFSNDKNIYADNVLLRSKQELCKYVLINEDTIVKHVFLINNIDTINSITYQCKITYGSYTYNSPLVGHKPNNIDNCNFRPRITYIIELKENECKFKVTLIDRSYN